MTPDDSRSDSALGEDSSLEAEMAALFEATAVEPDDFAVTRMTQRAKTVAADGPRGPSAWWRRLLGPGSLVLASAAGALVLVAALTLWALGDGSGAAESGGPGDGRGVPLVMNDVASSPAMTLVAEPGTSAADDELLEGDDLAAYEDDDDDLGGLDMLHLPEDPTEAEAVLAAYDTILGDG